MELSPRIRRHDRFLTAAWAGSFAILAALGVAGYTKRDVLMREWPAIKADLDMGVPVPLGLVRVKSANPLALGHNHQVLAYGYDLTGSCVTLSIYDPNLADADQVTLSLDLGNPGVRVPITMHPDGDLVSFFRVPYVAKDPLVE